MPQTYCPFLKARSADPGPNDEVQLSTLSPGRPHAAPNRGILATPSDKDSHLIRP